MCPPSTCGTRWVGAAAGCLPAPVALPSAASVPAALSATKPSLGRRLAAIAAVGTARRPSALALTPARLSTAQVDACADPAVVRAVASRREGTVCISGLTGEGLPELMERVSAKLQDSMVAVHVLVPYAQGGHKSRAAARHAAAAEGNGGGSRGRRAAPAPRRAACPSWAAPAAGDALRGGPLLAP